MLKKMRIHRCVSSSFSIYKISFTRYKIEYTSRVFLKFYSRYFSVICSHVKLDKCGSVHIGPPFFNHQLFDFQICAKVYLHNVNVFSCCDF